MDKQSQESSGHKPKQRTQSNSQFSSQNVHNNFPLMSCDSGLYTCSSNNSDTAFESDTDSSNFSSRLKQDQSLHLALQDVSKLRSELERLTKSEQWYKQELRNQKSTRLEDLERIYSRERKYMEENQRLQKECLRLYEKCSELEREVERQQQETTDSGSGSVKEADMKTIDGNTNNFEMQQQMSIISDQQKLIAVLRKQKKALLNDLKTLTEEKDEKIMELQKCLADLEFDNKCITKKCTELSKERSQLAGSLFDSRTKLSLALDEKLGLQKSLVSLKEQLDIQEKLVKLKENEIAQIENEFREKISNENDLDEVHSLSLKCNEDIKIKTIEIIELRTQISSMEVELEHLQELQAQNEQQQRLIEQLNFSLEASQMELQEIRKSQIIQTKRIDELQQETELLMQEKEDSLKEAMKQKHNFENICKELKNTKAKYVSIQNLYKETQFKLELCEMEQSKIKFQRESDQKEIQELRRKLSEYLQQTSNLIEKMLELETQLRLSVKENAQLKEELEKLQEELKDLLPIENNCTNECNEFRMDFMKLSKEFRRLQGTLENHGALTFNDTFQDMSVATDEITASGGDTDLKRQYSILQGNTDALEFFLNEKKNLVKSLTLGQDQNKQLDILLNENEVLKKRICEIENESNILQLKNDIHAATQKCISLQILSKEQERKVSDLQMRLLFNDSQLYKTEKQLKILQNDTTEAHVLFAQNLELKNELERERSLKMKLYEELAKSREQLEAMTQSLEEKTSSKPRTVNQAVQCDIQNQEELCQEVKHLKQQILDLQNKQDQYMAIESHKSDERLQLLNKLSDLQNSKMQCLQNNQQDWEDMLNSLNHVQYMEEQTRKELELKRMELEELNQVFAEQNEELKKLEEFTALLELKRQQEKEQIRQTFQTEIYALKEQVLHCQDEIRKQQEINRSLQERNSRTQQNYDEDCAIEVADYKNEVRALQTKIERTLQERDEMFERIRDLEHELNEMKNNRREAVLLPQQLALCDDASNCDTQLKSLDVKNQIGEDHIRILTKVLESEFARKMQRYDEHIHSLLSNVSALKKSLKISEQKAATLSEEHYRAMEEIKDFHKTRKNLEELRLKYEQSQNTIKELSSELSFERKKFESSDVGKSSQNEASTYEVSNLIDDYKKLIRQSAVVTKRPATNVILDLIQRSNQCVPNCKKLESGIDDLRNDLQKFLSSYGQKLPTSFINTATLTVPPSLMDELRAASESF
ncbi:uncharacterized protein [Musca autumnalis]|uniref:uncharacterized protein n=1 Tax=Musca autumnalis TaxID=221902 RepID=UPI003CFB2B1B